MGDTDTARSALDNLHALLEALNERLAAAQERVDAYDTSSSQAAADAVQSIKKGDLDEFKTLRLVSFRHTRRIGGSRAA